MSGNRKSRWSLPDPTPWQRARTFAVVTLVTVLIWVWAEAETQRNDLISPAISAHTEGSTTIDRLPLLLALPQSQLADGSASTDPRLDTHAIENVRIVGPASSLERIASGEARLQGVVVLNADHQDASQAARDQWVTLPVQVLPASLGLRLETPQSVRVRLRP